jgi:hypothetical protein
MVDYCDIRWNTIEESLVLIYRRLRDLWFVYCGGCSAIVNQMMDRAKMAATDRDSHL